MTETETETATSGTETTEGTTSGPNGEQWFEVDRMVPGGVLLSAASPSDNEVIFVGGQLKEVSAPFGGPGYLVRYRSDEGTICFEQDVAPRTLWWIDAPSADEWYAVGDAGMILHDEAGVRTDESVMTDNVLYGVEVDDETGRVYAVGGQPFGPETTGEIWVRETDGTWSLMAGDLPGVVFKVWGKWFVGDGVGWYLEGDTLVERPPPKGQKLLTVAGNDEGLVYAVGGTAQPTMLQWVDDAWVEIDVDPFCSSSGLNGVFVESDGRVSIAGNFGGLGSVNGGEWDCPDEFISGEHFHAAWAHGPGVFVAGGNLLNAGGNYGSLYWYGKPDDAPPIGDVTACP